MGTWMQVLGGSEASLLEWAVVIGTSLTGALTDLTIRRIPNALTIPVLLAGLGWATWSGGAAGLAGAAAGCLLLALPFVVLFLYAGGGAGDAKLMGAVGVWLGAADGLLALLYVVLAGVVLGLVFTAVRGRVRSVAMNLRQLCNSLVVLLCSRRLALARSGMPDASELHTIPYGIAILIGVSVAGAMGLWRA